MVCVGVMGNTWGLPGVAWWIIAVAGIRFIRVTPSCHRGRCRGSTSANTTAGVTYAVSAAVAVPVNHIPAACIAMTAGGIVVVAAGFAAPELRRNVIRKECTSLVAAPRKLLPAFHRAPGAFY